MRYGSVCSGIEAATAAWHYLGWEPVFFSEIEPFPKAVLAHHYPLVPDLGDFTKIGADVGPIDLLVGGTPCQSFSVAGLRAGLDDDRGNLALEFIRLAQRLQPRWIVWENVPGVLSSNKGRDFGTFLGALAEVGYGFAYRVLDAQFFGVPQRRRRVFLVGHAGGLWQRAAAVLFEHSSLRGDPAPSRKTREDVAGSLGGGSGARGWCNDLDRSGAFIPTAFGGGNTSGAIDVATACNCHSGRQDFESETFIAATLQTTRNDYSRADGFTAIPFDTTQITSALNRSAPAPGDPSHPLRSVANCEPAIAFHVTQDPISGEVAPAAFEPFVFANTAGDTALGMSRPGCPPLTLRNGDPGNVVAPGMAVRRLTPRECERLQGFPDDYTAIPGAKDGPRYRALGNSMAVPVMRWIGERIQSVDGITSAKTEAA